MLSKSSAALVAVEMNRMIGRATALRVAQALARLEGTSSEWTRAFGLVERTLGAECSEALMTTVVAAVEHLERSDCGQVARRLQLPIVEVTTAVLCLIEAGRLRSVDGILYAAGDRFVERIDALSVQGHERESGLPDVET